MLAVLFRLSALWWAPSRLVVFATTASNSSRHAWRHSYVCRTQKCRPLQRTLLAFRGCRWSSLSCVQNSENRWLLAGDFPTREYAAAMKASCASTHGAHSGSSLASLMHSERRWLAQCIATRNALICAQGGRFS